jgi:hypothetical protein
MSHQPDGALRDGTPVGAVEGRSLHPKGAERDLVIVFDLGPNEPVTAAEIRLVLALLGDKIAQILDATSPMSQIVQGKRPLNGTFASKQPPAAGPACISATATGTQAGTLSKQATPTVTIDDRLVDKAAAADHSDCTERRSLGQMSWAEMHDHLSGRGGRR